MPQLCDSGVLTAGTQRCRKTKISHVMGARSSVLTFPQFCQAGGTNSGSCGCSSSQGWAAPDALMAHLLQAPPTVCCRRSAGGHLRHNHGGSWGKCGTIEVLEVTQRRGFAELSTRTKPPRAQPGVQQLPNSTGAFGQPPMLCFLSSQHCHFHSRSGQQVLFSLAFHIGKLRQEVQPRTCSWLNRGPLGATAGCSNGLLVGEEEEEGLLVGAALPSAVGPASVDRRLVWP